MENKLQKALADKMWQEHKIGDAYFLVHANGKKEAGWKIAYYPLFGTWDNEVDGQGNTIKEKWVDFDEPRALIERETIFKKNINGIIKEEKGTDFREMPLRYLELNGGKF